MNRVYIVLLITAALAVSSVGATFSIAGLAQLFAGASFSVVLMAASLEFSKLVVAGFLYRYWGHINHLMRTYLCVALGILVAITSMGIFGYLSKAYQTSSLQLVGLNARVNTLKNEYQRIQDEIAQTQAFIDSVPRSRISKKFALHKESQPHLRALRERGEENQRQLHQLELQRLNVQTEVGPIIYVAETFGTEVDRVVRILILLFVSVFDPLAICLVFAANLALRLKEKYRGNERKIAELALAKPVDHRRKSA
ncbi:MAG: hypothetical protein IT289_03490 [Oligoflexia bacterium]|nr:hypothetical protein [Oligoflexia bacterium]